MEHQPDLLADAPFQEVLGFIEGGIETMLSLRCILPSMPMTAGLSANHLAALLLPNGLRRLYIARDNDSAGRHATETLAERAHAAGIETLQLIPALGDFNDDLRQLRPSALAEGVRLQIDRVDTERFLISDRSSRAA